MEILFMYDKFYDVFLPQPLIWKDIEGFEGYYQVSNYGQLRSLDRHVTFEWKGKLATRLFEGKVLAPKYDKDGYESYCLSLGKGNKKHLRGHRVVAQAFVPNIKEVGVVDHKDATVTHNFSWNLQWMTNTQNTIKHYAIDAGLDKPLSSLTNYEWFYIGYLFNEGLEYKDICANLGIGAKSPDTLWEGLSGKRLKSVTGFKKGDFKKRKHPVTKLDICTVCNIIKERLIDGVPLRDLSIKYSIAESMVSRFCSGKRQPEGLLLFNERYKI